MFTELDTVLSLLGLVVFLSGIYLWLGLAAVLILLGIILVLIGWRLPTTQIKRDKHEPD